MSKKQKKPKYQDKKCNWRHKYWWIVCVYLIVPIITVLFFYLVFTPLLKGFMSGIRIGGVYILNSTYATERVIYPFVESLMIIMGVVVSYVVLRILKKKLLKKEIYFGGVKKCLKYFETFTILLTIIIAVYSKVNDFDYSQYGYNIDTMKEVIAQEDGEQNIPLEKIPSLHSTGIRSDEANLLYKMLLCMSNIVFFLLDNLEMLVAIVTAVIIPMKNYLEEIDEMKTKKITSNNG